MARSADYMRFFPYPEAYAHQREAMARIREALRAPRDVLFEGACGTGKTLAALVPALDHARANDKTVVITTNVHQQMRQFTHEARAIARQTAIRAVVFRGKASMCHVDVGYEECQALRDATRELVDLERDDAALDDDVATLREERNVCERYYENLTADTDGFYEWLFDGVRTPDEIYEHAHELGFCGYELLKEGIEGVDLAVCNYHHLLDPAIREQFFRWLGRDPEDVVAVFDEAHNVERAARDHARRTLAEPTFDGALAELDEVDDRRATAARNVLEPFRDALVAAYEDSFGFGDREARSASGNSSGRNPRDPEQVGDTWEDVSVDNESGRDDLTLAFLDGYTGPGYAQDLDRALNLGRELDERYEQAYREGETTTRRECRVLQAASFVEAWMERSGQAGQYPVVSVRRVDGTVRGRAELYTCLPRQVTRGLFDELHASVLMSATLRPFDVLAEVLGIEDPATMAYGPQFPEERRRTYAVSTPALFARRRADPDVQQVVTRALEDAVRFTPGNVLAFFPSYAEAERYHDRLDVDATRYLDEPGTRAEGLREEFVADDRAVLCTSLWGTLGEGVSYDGDDARTVAVVGVPYPHLDDRLEAVQRAYDGAFEAEDAGWRYAVEIPTVRKTRQALGRVVRSPEDFGARILLDERYTAASRARMADYSVHDTFPREERAEMIDLDPGKLKFALLNFYADVGAWDGDPPTP